MSTQKCKKSLELQPPKGPRISRSGWAFDPADDMWVIREDVREFRFNFSGLYATPNNINAFRHVVAWYIENLSGAAANNYFQEFRRFLKGLSELGHARPDQIGLPELLSYRSEFSHPRMRRFGAVSRVIRKWHALGVPGVSEAAANLLEELTIPGNEKGTAIRTMDPFTGPLIDVEYDSVVAGLRDRYESGELSTGDYVLALLVVALGPRPLQLAALKLKDLVVGKDSDGSDVYILRVPRAKQPGHQLRRLFTDRLLHSELGRLVARHMNSIRSQYENLMSNSDDAPLFPAQRPKLRPTGFEHHSSSDELSKRFRLIVESLKLKSIRTGQLMRVTPYRFRRTVGTRAAAEGFGELVIAAVLDHSDTQNVGVYVENVPAFVERIDRAAAFHFAAMANAFMGEIVSRRDNASPSTRWEEIWSPQFSKPGNSSGGCAEKSPCAALAPIACYTCRRFRPFHDGPHDVVLDHLLQQRDVLIAKDERVAKVLDRTILAVAQVIQKCGHHRRVK